MDQITKEDAILRIKDIQNNTGTDHLHGRDCHTSLGGFCSARMREGAINELMAIFDIKEEDL